MSVRRKFNFEYYQVVILKDTDSETAAYKIYDFEKWLSVIDEQINDEITKEKNFGKVTVDYYEDKARIENISYDKKNQKWFVSFFRLRESKIPYLTTEDGMSNVIELEVDEYLGEDVHCLFDKETAILLIQRNFFSLSVKGIEDYINITCPVKNHRIKLLPLLEQDTLNKVMKAKDIRTISVRFANFNTLNLDDEPSIKQLQEATNEYEAVNVEIKMSVGMARNKSLKKDKVMPFISAFKKINLKHITKSRISIKEDEDTKVEELDLIEQKIRDSEYINVPRKSTVNPDEVKNVMTKKFNERKNDILKHLGDGKDEMYQGEIKFFIPEE